MILIIFMALHIIVGMFILLKGHGYEQGLVPIKYTDDHIKIVLKIYTDTIGFGFAIYQYLTDA